jgi:hypothetical protein
VIAMQHAKSLVLQLALVLAVSALIASCGGSSSDGRPPATTFSEIFDMMYPMSTNARCTACHSQPPNDVFNGNLQMGADKDSVYEALVGKMSSSSHCGGKTYVVPGHPEQSLLLQKVTDPPPCGNRMPLGGTPFNADQLEMIRSWIADGAKND